MPKHKFYTLKFTDFSWNVRNFLLVFISCRGNWVPPEAQQMYGSHSSEVLDSVHVRPLFWQNCWMGMTQKRIPRLKWSWPFNHLPIFRWTWMWSCVPSNHLYPGHYSKIFQPERFLGIVFQLKCPSDLRFESSKHFCPLVWWPYNSLSTFLIRIWNPFSSFRYFIWIVNFRI